MPLPDGVVADPLVDPPCTVPWISECHNYITRTLVLVPRHEASAPQDTCRRGSDSMSHGGRRRVRTGDFGDRATWPMPELRPADSSADCRGAGRPGRPVDVQSIRLLRPMPPQSGARAGYSRLCIPERLPDGHAQPAQTCAYNRMSWQVETAATLPAGGGAPGGGGGVAILSLLTTVLWMRDFAERVW